MGHRWHCMVVAFAVAAASSAHGAEEISWNGITLYGAVDLGIAHQSHGTPLSQDWFVGLEYLISKNSNKPVTSIGPNGLSQSKIGLKGKENLVADVDVVFNVEAGFDPQSGNLADALAALQHNNGVPLERQTSAGDSSRAGQLFNGPAYAGFASPTYGTITLGRNNTLLLDDILKYDPMGGSYAFSVIGLSGVVAGMGDTEDARLDASAKYLYAHEGLRAGVLYQPGHTDSSPGKAWQGTIGFDLGTFSLDAVYGHKDDAIAASSLSVAQAATAPPGSLAATISDNTSYTLAASYAAGAWKAFGGYEHIRFENPSHPLAAGIAGLGGYTLGIVNNTAFAHARVLQASWLGLRWRLSDRWDVTGAWYHYDQNSFGATRCSDARAGSCSGTLDAYSMMTDYKLNARWDTYAGVMYSKVADGLASGYLNESTVSPMVGLRFRF